MEARSDDGAQAMVLSVRVRPSYGGCVGLRKWSGSEVGAETDAMGMSVLPSARSTHIVLIVGKY